MTQELQPILERIQREGVEKAQEEAARIISAAKAQSEQLLESARVESQDMRESARKDGLAFAERATETIRQAARDTVKQVEKSVTELFATLLLKEVSATMNNEQVVAELAQAAVHRYLEGNSSVELSGSAELVDMLRTKLSDQARRGLEITTDAALQSGFRIKLDSGRVEHTFTGAAVAEALSKLLRPQLAELMQP